jgi:hypothetical protein
MLIGRSNLKFNLDAKRLGIIALFLVILVIGIEGTLTLLRKRDVSASISVVSQRPTATPTVLGQANGATPDPLTVGLIMTDDGSVVVRATWAYSIGPRFPQTTIRALALDKDNQVVASASQFVDCSASTLSCDGNAVLSLRYGEMAQPDSETTRTPQPTPSATGRWPLGDYTILVTRAYEGFNAVDVAREKITVAAE